LRLNAKCTRYIEYNHYFFLPRVGYVDNRGFRAGSGILIEILIPTIGFLNKLGRVDPLGFLDFLDFLNTRSFLSALDVGLGLGLGLDLGLGLGLGLELYLELYLDLGLDLGVLDLD